MRKQQSSPARLKPMVQMTQMAALAIAGLGLGSSAWGASPAKAVMKATAETSFDCRSVRAWSAGTTYVKPNQVKYADVVYLANWYNSGSDPASHSGPYDIWTRVGICDVTPPGAPDGLTLTGQSDGSVSFSWNSASDSGVGVASYNVYRGDLLVGNVSNTSFSDTGLNGGSNYSYRVRALDKAGNESAGSAPLQARTSGMACLAAPATPTALAPTAVGSSNIALRWNGAAAAANCNVRYRVFSVGSQVADVSITGASFNGLPDEANFTYTVVAYNQAGTSAPSAPLMVSTGVNPDAPKRVIGYFAQWGVYDRGYHVKNIDTSGSAAQLTHINYAFGNVRNNRCEVGVTQTSDMGKTGVGGDALMDYGRSYDASGSIDGVADVQNQPLRGSYNQLKKLKAKYPQIKVLISLGGWTYSQGFNSAAKAENRVAFVASCIDAYIKGNFPQINEIWPKRDGGRAGGVGVAAGVFDGIDIDWEYPAANGLKPGAPEDTANFTALIAEFRKQLDAVRPGLLLTIAAPAGVDKIRVIEPQKFYKDLNFINVMTYDFHGAWEPTTNFHAPLYASSADPSTGDVKKYNTHDALSAYFNAGVPARKLNLGIGFYGRGHTKVANVNNGLYQAGIPAPGQFKEEPGIADYRVLKTLGYPSFVDPQTRAQWIYNGSTFWSFDTPVQIKEKMDYVKSKGMGGAFFWEFSGDDKEATLINTIGRALQ